jgi:hypothetical protein
LVQERDLVSGHEERRVQLENYFVNLHRAPDSLGFFLMNLRPDAMGSSVRSARGFSASIQFGTTISQWLC